MSHCKARGHNLNNGAVVRSDSLDRDVRCRITITVKPSMGVIAFSEPIEITIYQLVQVYKVKHLKQQLVNGLSRFKCVLDDLHEPPYRLISATVHGKRRAKLKDDIIQLLHKFSGYCEECTITWKSFKILRDSDFLFTVIRDSDSEIHIVYCKDDYIEWSVYLEGCSEKQKLGLMALLDDVNQTKCMLNGNEITIFTSPRNTDLILDICHNFDNGGYTMIYRGTSNESHISTNICDGKDTLHSNDSEDQPNLSSNTEPGDTNSKRQSPSSLKTEPEDMTMHNDTDVTSTTIPEPSGGAGNWSEDFVFLDHPENGEEKSFGSNSDQEKDMDDDTNKDDKNRLSSTSSVTPNYLNTGGDDLKRIDSIYSTLFAKRKLILDEILNCFSQSGYNKRLCFNEDGSIEPPLNNQEFFTLYVAIRKYLNIKKMLTTRYDLPDGWFDSVNIIEKNIVVEKRESHIVIVGVKDIVDRVLVNLRQYRKEGVSTEDFQQIETNLAAESTEYLYLYSYGIRRPVDCEYVCKAGDQLLHELQQRYRCFIDIQPLVTGTKEIHFANWIHDSKEAGYIIIPLVIGNYRELPQQTNILVLTQNQKDQCYESGQNIGDHLTLLKHNEGQARHIILQNIVSSRVKIKQDLEEVVNKRGCKILILLMDKTTEKETVSFFLSVCKNQTKRIYLPKESIPQSEFLRNLFPKGKLEYGGQGHYIEMKIGQINNQEVDIIVDVVENKTQSGTYTIKETKATVGVHQYRFELNIPPYIYDASNPMINLSFLVMKCLIDASKIKMASIAFPVMGVGSSGYPVKLVARSMLETIDEYFRCQNETSLCQVMIVIEDGDTSSKKAFFRENLTRIKEGRMTGDRVYKVGIEITGDERDKWRIEKEIDDIIAKKEVVFNDISNPIREVRMAADRFDEVNKKLTGDKTERPTTESGLETPVKIAKVTSMKERDRPKTEREAKEDNSSKKPPVVVHDISGTNREVDMDVLRKHAHVKRDETHESRCVIMEFTAKDIGMADIKNVLVPILKKDNQPLCVVSPFQGNIYSTFMAFGSKRAKDDACAVIKKKYKSSKFIDIPVSQEVINPVINRVNIHMEVEELNVLKTDLLNASGVITISNNGEVFIEGCPQQIELAKTMLQKRYGKKCNKNLEPQRAQVEPYSVTSYKFRAFEYIFGEGKMKKICRDIKEADEETHFTLPKHPKDRDLVEDLKDLMDRRIRHEEIDITDDKIEEAKRYSRNHAYMDTVYVEFDSKTSSIHILGEDYVEVEDVSYQAKVAVSIIKLTNKKQQRTRTDEYTPTPTVKLPPAEIQERIFHTKCTNLTVHVKKNDITKLDVDVIVNAANGMMMHGGGVARFIATAGGDELERECRRYIHDNGQLPVTGICKTTGGNMWCKQVYHAVGPYWSDYSNKSDCEDDLCKTIVRCLVEADQDGFQSIAIPSISSAIFGVPKNICAHMYAKAVKSFDAVHPVSNLREIYFVDVLDGMVSMVQTGFDMFFTQGNDDDDVIKEEIERFIKEITCKGDEKQSEGEITDNKPPEFSMIAVTKEVVNKPYITCSLHVAEAIAKNPVCSRCRNNAYGEIQTGNQPHGKMVHSILHTSLKGFPHCDTIEIIYTFHDGIQVGNHPRPGYPFKGKTETAYLPDNMEGREILKLLKLAFDRRLIFTVSPDVTSSPGREFVTWNNIPHKTRQDGGPESNGYPDPDYLTQVRKALYTRGVVIERQHATREVDRIENFRDGNELIEALQGYENIEITVKTELVIKRFGTIINHDDLVLSLNVKEWLHDKIIDAYLSLLSENEKQHGNIYVMPTYIAALMLEEHYDQCMSSLANVKLDEYTWVFIPVNTHNHWVLLAANIKQGRVSLLDSLPDGNTDVVHKWSKFMNYRGEKTGELNIDWVECNDWVSSKQRDLASCGPFVLLNALAISRNIKPQCFNTEHAKLMRKLVYYRITEKRVAGHC